MGEKIGSSTHREESYNTIPKQDAVKGKFTEQSSSRAIEVDKRGSHDNGTASSQDHLEKISSKASYRLLGQ